MGYHVSCVSLAAHLIFKIWSAPMVHEVVNLTKSFEFRDSDDSDHVYVCDVHTMFLKSKVKSFLLLVVDNIIASGG